MKEPPMSVVIMGIPEPTTTSVCSSQWSAGQLSSTGGIKSSQWSDQDLDDFVKQLSNPQHHISKIGSQSSTTTPPSTSPRKASLDLHSSRPRRAPLARSETDTGVHFADHLSPTSPKESSGGFFSSRGPRHSSESGSGLIAGSLLSGLSGLRLIKSKKMARSSYANAKKSATHKSFSQEDWSSQKDESSSNGSGARSRVTSTGSSSLTGEGSSPEGSDGERGDERKLSIAKDSDVKEGKKRRFRRMLTRPLSRSQSAGCAKDVPAHALFLGKQRKNSDEDKDSASRRQDRCSEGDIRHMPVFDDELENEDDEDNIISSSPPSSSSSSMMTTSRSSSSIGKKGASGSRGGLHKMESMDAAMFGEDFGSDSKPKHKNYNIAKRISRHMQFLRRRHTDSTIGVMDKEEARRLAEIEPTQVQEWSKSFESLLFDKNGLELFRGFLISEHSDENIEFWIACEKYKVVKSHKQLLPLAHKIFNDYVAVQSKREVNLDSKTRTSTYENVTSSPNRQTFDDAQKRVQALMEKDSYRRFLESELYVDLAAGNLHHKQ